MAVRNVNFEQATVAEFIPELADYESVAAQRTTIPKIRYAAQELFLGLELGRLLVGCAVERIVQAAQVLLKNIHQVVITQRKQFRKTANETFSYDVRHQLPHSFSTKIDDEPIEYKEITTVRCLIQAPACPRFWHTVGSRRVQNAICSGMEKDENIIWLIAVWTGPYLPKKSFCSGRRPNLCRGW